MVDGSAVVDGIAVVDKAPGWTSHDVVARARRHTRQRRVGHAGTLDPPATGVLVLGFGRATRLLRFVTDHPKRYVGEVVLGVETATLDDTGEPVATHDMAAVSAGDVRAAAAGLVGEIEQVPPMVSAVKVGGERLHRRARAGEEVAREPRRVTVHELDVAPTAEAGVWRLEVTCSSGTYVRSLAADLGAALGGGAHLRGLRRTAVGPFTEAEARPVDELEVLALPEALRGYPSVAVDEGLARQVANGRVLGRGALGVGGPGPWAVLDPAGELLAVYESRGDDTKPAVVLPPR